MRLRIIDFKNNKVYEHRSDELSKGIGKKMLQKYPGGRWVTMNGRHVYIKKDGTVSKETDPRTTKPADIRSKASRLYDNPVETVNTGSVYRYGNKVVMATKVGNKYVAIKDANGNTRQVLKTKFAKNAEKEAGGKNSVEDLKKIAENAPASSKTEQGTENKTTNDGTVGEKVDEKEPAKDTKTAGTENQQTADGSEEAGDSVKTNYASQTPEVMKKKGFAFADGFNGDEVYDTYQQWKKHADTAPVYFEIKMVQFGDIPPERLEKYGINLRSIRKGNEIAGLVQLQEATHPDGGNIVEIGYVEIAPHMRKGNGLGTQIIANAIADSYDRGYGGRIFLKAHSDAIGFYKKLGMNWVGGPHNMFDFTSKQAQAFYKHVTGVELGGTTIEKSIKNLTKEGSVRPAKLPSLEELQKAEDKLFPTGMLIGDFTERMKAQSKPKYESREVPLDEE